MSGNSASKMSDFGTYASQIAKISPTILNAASFTPTNTAQRSCPSALTGSATAATAALTASTAWEAATALPPTPNEQLCECMVSALTCVAKSSVSTNAYTDLFATACKGGACSGIVNNGDIGSYGAYAMCNDTQKLNYAFNAYYNSASSANKGQACDFAGNATTQSASTPSACSSLLSQAGGVQGTGVVTSKPSSTGSSSSGSSSSVAVGVTVPGFDFGLMKLGMYVVTAAMVGAGVVFV